MLYQLTRFSGDWNRDNNREIIVTVPPDLTVYQILWSVMTIVGFIFLKSSKLVYVPTYSANDQ